MSSKDLNRTDSIRKHCEVPSLLVYDGYSLCLFGLPNMTGISLDHINFYKGPPRFRKLPRLRHCPMLPSSLIEGPSETVGSS